MQPPPPPSPPPQDSTLLYWNDSGLDDKNFEIHCRTLIFNLLLFSISLLTFLLFLYLRYVCRSRYPSRQPPLSPHPLSNCAGGGLDVEMIKVLPVVLWQEVEDEKECCICLGEFEDGDEVKVLPGCRHCYHCECVDLWLRAESSCPLCRNPLRVDSDVTIVTE